MVLPYINNASFYLARQDSVNAIKWLEKAAVVKPDNRKVTGVLARYYAGKGNKEKAAHYQKMFDSAQANQ